MILIDVDDFDVWLNQLSKSLRGALGRPHAAWGEGPSCLWALFLLFETERTGAVMIIFSTLILNVIKILFAGWRLSQLPCPTTRKLTVSKWRVDIHLKDFALETTKMVEICMVNICMFRSEASPTKTPLSNMARLFRKVRPPWWDESVIARVTEFNDCSMSLQRWVKCWSDKETRWNMRRQDHDMSLFHSGTYFAESGWSRAVDSVDVVSICFAPGNTSCCDWRCASPEVWRFASPGELSIEQHDNMIHIRHRHTSTCRTCQQFPDLPGEKHPEEFLAALDCDCSLGHSLTLMLDEHRTEFGCDCFSSLGLRR